MMLTTRYAHRCPFEIEGLAITLPPMQGDHENRLPWQGVLTRLDEPSTRPPGGAEGHRVLIPRSVADAALPSLIGMPVNFTDDLQGHNKKQPIGVIYEAHIEGKDLHVSGVLFSKNFPDEVARIQANKHSLGMSYELADCEIEDPAADIWTVRHLKWTGGAILKKDSAAYARTSLAAATEELSMAESDAIFDQLTKLNTSMSILASHDQQAEEEAARADEAEAARLAEQAAAARKQALQAWGDDDADDAAAQDEDAAAKHQSASAKRLAAAQRYDALAARCKEASDEEGATKFEASAKRLREEDASQQALVAAAVKEREQQASASKEAPEDRMVSLFGKFMGLMAQANGTTKKLVDAEHDDEEEDKALIRQMLKQERGTQKAATAPPDLQTRRWQRQIQAQMELLTDTVSKMTGLLTDVVAQTRGLATDTHRGNNGGPVRRSMAGAGERYVGKFDGQEQGTTTKTEAEFDAELQASGITDPRKRMELAFEARAAGQIH